MECGVASYLKRDIPDSIFGIYISGYTERKEAIYKARNWEFICHYISEMTR